MQSFRTEIENPIIQQDIIDLEQKISKFKLGEIDEEKEEVVEEKEEVAEVVEEKVVAEVVEEAAEVVEEVAEVDEEKPKKLFYLKYLNGFII
jgi:hypothetical protein